MIEFVVVENNPRYQEMILKVLNQVLKNKDNLYFNISFFEKCDEELTKKIQSKGEKIYLLSLMLEEKSGIDLALDIRKFDMNSQIIILSNMYEAMDIIMKRIPMIYDVIEKFEFMESKLESDLERLIHYLKYHQVINICEDHYQVQILMDQIVYVYKDKEETILYLKNGVYKTTQSFSKIQKFLNDSFILIYENCLVNKKVIEGLIKNEVCNKY